MKLLKIAGFTLLGLMILLIPLFGVYVATAQALPDDRIYPLKQQAEGVIDKLALVTPLTNAQFSLLKSQRRYQEIVGMVNQNKDINGFEAPFLAQIRQTLLDIQGVNDENSRINLYAKYQEFLSNAHQSFIYQIEGLENELKRDKSAKIKTFKVEAFGGQDGRLVARPTTLQQQDIVEKVPVSDELLISNIDKLKSINQGIQGLLKK